MRHGAPEQEARSGSAVEAFVTSPAVWMAHLMSLQGAGAEGCVCSSDTFFWTRSEISRDYPLNLSISLSGGKETNQDSPSNGE